MEQTYVMIKPDAVQRNLIGSIIERFEKKGLKIKGLKMIRLSKELAQKHYEEHKNKPFFGGLVEFITSGPVVAMVIEGKDAVAVVRKMMGATNPIDSENGSLRGDFGIDLGRNVVHGSDSPESALREISLYFTDKEILDYNKDVEKWVYEN